MTEAKYSRYDSADFLETDEDITNYLEIVMEESGGDRPQVTRALGVIARARTISHLVEQTGMSRAGICKALAGDGNPSFATISKIANALGLQIMLRPDRSA